MHIAGDYRGWYLVDGERRHGPYDRSGVEDAYHEHTGGRPVPPRNRFSYGGNTWLVGDEAPASVRLSEVVNRYVPILGGLAIMFFVLSVALANG